MLVIHLLIRIGEVVLDEVVEGVGCIVELLKLSRSLLTLNCLGGLGGEDGE